MIYKNVDEKYFYRGRKMKKNLLLILSAVVCATLSAKEITVFVTAGENWKEKREPQVAIWLEDENGSYIKTLYVTNRASKKNWIMGPKEGRPESLPVWYHASKFNSSKYVAKNVNSSDVQIDAVTSATPKSAINFTVEVDDKPCVIKAEFNNSFDYNDFYTKKTSGVNGQPSVVYETELPSEIINEIQLQFVGTGDLNGKDGNVSTDISNLTTANKIVKNIVVSR